MLGNETMPALRLDVRDCALNVPWKQQWVLVTSTPIFDYTFLRRSGKTSDTLWNGQGRTFLTWGVTYLAPFFFQKLSVVIYIHMYNRVNLKLFVYALNFFCPTKIFPRTHSSSLKSCCLVVCSTIVCSLGKVKKNQFIREVTCPSARFRDFGGFQRTNYWTK